MPIISLSGPSGVGKSAIIAKLIELIPDSVLSVSCTTREPRPGEIPGVHYHYLSDTEFDDMVEAEKFVEWKQYNKSRYGTPKEPIEAAHAKDKFVLMDLEVEGAVDLRTFCFHQSIILFDFFIMPPSMSALEERLLKRNSESPEEIAARIRRGREEVLREKEFKLTVINDDLDRCVREILDEFWF